MPTFVESLEPSGGGGVLTGLSGPVFTTGPGPVAPTAIEPNSASTELDAATDPFARTSAMNAAVAAGVAVAEAFASAGDVATLAAAEAYTDSQVGTLAAGVILKDGTVAFTGDQSLGSHKLTDVTDPSALQDAATKNYVDTAIASSGSGGAAQNSFLVTGGAVEWLTGLNFMVGAALYWIQGVQYSSPMTAKTLAAADPTNPRLDLFVVDTSGVVSVITGTPAANPSLPDYDAGTQLPLPQFVLIPAGATQPGITSTVVYFENAGSPGEWNWAAVGSGVNVNSTNNPKSPATKDIELTNAATGAYAEGTIGSGTFDLSASNLLVIYIRSKATWNGNRGIGVTLRTTSGVQVGQQVNIERTGTFGFDSSQTSAYQLVGIPISLFGVSAAQSIIKVRLAPFGSGIGAYVADIKFQAGGAPPSATGITQAQADARYLQQANNLSDLANKATARANLFPADSMLVSQLATAAKTHQVTLTIDGNGATITTGQKNLMVPVPISGTITQWTVLEAAGGAGDIVVDIYRTTYANYDPPTHPASGDSLVGGSGNKPTITATNKKGQAAPSSWTSVTLTAGDILDANVVSVTTFTKVVVALTIVGT